MALLAVACCVLYPVWTWSNLLGVAFSLAVAIAAATTTCGGVGVVLAARSGSLRIPPRVIYEPTLVSCSGTHVWLH